MKNLTGRLAAALAATAALTLLSGCTGDSAANPSEADSDDAVYKGETLHCVWLGKSSSCDFDRFYAQHPNLLEVSADDPDNDDLYFVKFKDGVLTCVWRGSAASCDYDEFYAQYPRLLGTGATAS